MKNTRKRFIDILVVLLLVVVQIDNDGPGDYDEWQTIGS